MSLLANNVIKNVIGDLAVYTVVDSIKSKEIDLSDLPLNALAVGGYNLLVRNFAAGKLNGLLDPASASIIEDYSGRFASLYLAEMFMGKSRDFKNTAKDQLYYSVAIYLTTSAYSQFGLNKIVDPRAAQSNATAYKP